MRRSWCLLVLAALAGCATHGAPEMAEYACPDGRGFRLLTRGDDARIVLDGMKFDLRREATASGVTRYTCNMLSVELRSPDAEVDREGVPHLRQCRRVR